MWTRRCMWSGGHLGEVLHADEVMRVDAAMPAEADVDVDAAPVNEGRCM